MSGGKVHLNGRRPKRSSDVRVGDRIRIRKRYYEYELIVEGLAERRGPASEAARLYEETAESKRARERRALQLKMMPHFDFRDGGRPSKKERREIDRLRGYRKK